MICAQSGTAKVRERLAGTLPAAPAPPAPLRPSLGVFLAAREAPAAPSLPGAGIHPPSHPLASPARFNCQPGARSCPGTAGMPGCRPGLGYSRRTRPSCGARKETKKPPSGFAAPPPPLGALPVARRCQGRGRRDLRNPPSQPTPTPCEPQPRICASLSSRFWTIVSHAMSVVSPASAHSLGISSSVLSSGEAWPGPALAPLGGGRRGGCALWVLLQRLLVPTGCDSQLGLPPEFEREMPVVSPTVLRPAHKRGGRYPEKPRLVLFGWRCASYPYIPQP